MKTFIASVAYTAILILMLTVLGDFLKAYVSMPIALLFFLVVELVPTLLFAKGFLSCASYGVLGGALLGLIETLLNGGYAPSYVILNMLTGLSLGLGSYPYIRTKNALFLAIPLMLILPAFLIQYFYAYYSGDIGLGLASLLYVFR